MLNVASEYLIDCGQLVNAICQGVDLGPEAFQRVGKNFRLNDGSQNQAPCADTVNLSLMQIGNCILIQHALKVNLAEIVLGQGTADSHH